MTGTMLSTSELAAAADDCNKFLSQYQRVARAAAFFSQITNVEQTINERNAKLEEVTNMLADVSQQHNEASRELAKMKGDMAKLKEQHEDMISRDIARVERANHDLNLREKALEDAEANFRAKCERVAHDQANRRQELDAQAFEISEAAEELDKRKKKFAKRVEKFNAISAEGEE